MCLLTHPNQEDSMSNPARRLWPVMMCLLVPATAQDSPRIAPVRTWPLEFQLSLDRTSYDSHAAQGSLGSFKATADPVVTPGLRFSFEPICIPKGRLQFSAGYRFGTDVDVFHGSRAPFDLKDRGQVQVGALYFFPEFSNFELGLGLDLRQDSMKATGPVGAPTDDAQFRGWVRGVARYNIAWKEDRSFFVALEAAAPFGQPKINDSVYYQDYRVLTGLQNLGPIANVQAGDSLVRGHFPTFQVSLAGGIRFGSYTKPCAPVAKPEPKPEPKVEPETTRAAAAEVATKPALKEFEGLVVYFKLNSSKKTKDTLQLVREWAKANKEKVEGSVLTVAGHTDKSGTRPYNEKLSLSRAQAVAQVLREEGIAVEDVNVAGKAWDEPAVDNTSAENRSTNRRTEVGVKDTTRYKVVGSKKSKVIVVALRGKKAE